MKKYKILIIDDSALIREILTDIINGLDELEVIGTAPDPHVGADKIVKLSPDAVTLDIEMPKMDGLTFLEKLMRIRPIPVLIFSSLTSNNSKELGLKALELGAVDYITKPTQSLKDSIEELTIDIEMKLKACVVSKVKRSVTTKIEVEEKYSVDQVVKSKSRINFETTEKVIVIGASTGGTVAISKLLMGLPTNIPGIVIVQHMPAGFTKSFAQRLDNESNLYVKEAEENDTILSGQVLLAPGGKHMVMNRSGTRYFVNINDGVPVNRHKPSVDVLFRSAAQTIGPNAIGIILTGMGDDGADAMLEMKESGSYNIAQNEDSCIVFGMPKVAIEKGGVDKIISLDEIHQFIMNCHNS